MTPSLYADVRHDLAEGPVWHDGALWWVNITEGRLYRKSGDGEIRHWEVGTTLGVALPARDGWWWTARERDCAWLHVPTGRVVPIESEVPELPPAHRFNDGFCGPDGHPWVGSAALDDSRGTAALYRADASAALHIVRRGITLSNGLGWSPDGTQFYYVDSLAYTLEVFEYDSRNHILGEPKTLRTFPRDQGLPDGLSIDAEGQIWLAVWGGSAVLRIDSSTGEILEQVDLPVTQVTSCCFGGPDNRTLFITSARGGLSDEDLTEQPHAGSIFAADAGVSGLGPQLCAIAPPPTKNKTARGGQATGG